MSRILAIDPGPELSAYVLYNTETRAPESWAKLPSEDITSEMPMSFAETCAIEGIASYGMAVGASVFSTAIWIGRYTERWFATDRSLPRLVYRREVKLHLCGDSRAKDGNIRQAIIDRYGGKEKAIGRKATPGPLLGLSGDCWSALGVAITAAETQQALPLG